MLLSFAPFGARERIIKQSRFLLSSELFERYVRVGAPLRSEREKLLSGESEGFSFPFSSGGESRGNASMPRLHLYDFLILET